MADLQRQTQALGRRPALILVDVTNGFTDPESPLGSESDSVVSACGDLLAAARSRSLPICFTTVVYDEPEQASVFRARLPALNTLARGGSAAGIDPRVAPRENERVVEKQFASAFFGTDLAEWLRAEQADSLIVCGLTTSGCVRATVVDGLQHNFPVWVPEESVGDRNADAHRANLHDMHAKYAEVVTLAETLGHIEALPEVAA